MSGAAIYIAAFIIDLVLGDPQNWPHPVRWIGHTIDQDQYMIRKRVSSPEGLYRHRALDRHLWELQRARTLELRQLRQCPSGSRRRHSLRQPRSSEGPLLVLSQQFQQKADALLKKYKSIDDSLLMREAKNESKMTNLKAGSGPTMKPVQGPRICPILGHGCWSSNRRFVDPEPSLKGLRSSERNLF